MLEVQPIPKPLILFISPVVCVGESGTAQHVHSPPPLVFGVHPVYSHLCNCQAHSMLSGSM